MLNKSQMLYSVFALHEFMISISCISNNSDTQSSSVRIVFFLFFFLFLGVGIFSRWGREGVVVVVRNFAFGEKGGAILGRNFVCEKSKTFLMQRNQTQLFDYSRASKCSEPLLSNYHVFRCLRFR